jgi:uncharacterized protein (TIGR02271 family)
MSKNCTHARIDSILTLPELAWQPHQQREKTMQNDTWTINGGSDVIGSDGEKVGSVDAVEASYIVVKKGWFFPTDYYIPVDAISSVTDEQVVLNVTRDQALSQGWDTVPGDTGAGGYIAGYDEAAVRDTDVVGASTGGDTGQPFDHRATSDSTHLDTDDTIRVPLAEEELTATRRQVERGEVRVDKEVVAEEQTLDVPVTEERVNVTRHVVDRDLQAGDANFEEGTIEVPVRGEEVDLHKQARVREEIEISKEAVERTEQVSDTVRRERARVVDTTETVDGDELLDDEVNRR